MQELQLCLGRSDFNRITPFLPGDVGMDSVVCSPLPAFVGQESKRLGELFTARKVFLLD